ncbi:MAG: hypothetical protein WCY58_12920 [Mariniphaga sp.]
MKNINSISRRKFINQLMVSGAVLGGNGLLVNQLFAARSKSQVRRFHISLQAEAWKKNPELIGLMKEAGVSDVWMASYLQGKWYHTPKELRESADFLESKGFNPHVLTVPLGHPGNAIDPSDGTWSEKKQSWKNACDYDGSLYSGTSIHAPVVEDNIEANKLLANEGFDTLFLDDDFRLARYPGTIGGCFCDECKNEFLQKYNYPAADWDILIDSVEKRNPSKVLRSWVEFICDKVNNMFVSLQKATPQMETGIMVMYLGAEKAGIALDKYRNVPFRVGEMMFSDKNFGNIKGKTDELFSALFHMRFIKPELAYSETTAYPQDELSAKNMAAKLSVSLFSDVRNTMFMSGLQHFPVEHWKTLAPAMKKSAHIHEEIAGLKTVGPFKHFWGWDSRLVGHDKPFSLFLASGIPFEVIDDVTEDGWIFLSDEDAKSVVEERVTAKSNNLVVRKEAGIQGDEFIELNETLVDIFALKKRIIPTLNNIPYAEGETPVIFSWYPDEGKALLWNVNEERQNYVIKRGDKIVQSVVVEGLDVTLISNRELFL